MHQLGSWADRMVGRTRPMYVTETPIGGGTGFLDDDVEADRRSRRMEGLGRALLGALLDGCLQHDVAITSGARATRLVLGAGPGRRCRAGRARGAAVGWRRPAASCSRPAGSSGTATWSATSSAARCATRPASRPTPATGCGWRCASARSSARCARRGGCRSSRCPASDDYGEQGVQLVLRERTLPRSIMVNRRGRRFTNEAANYNALGGAFHQFDAATFEYANQPAGWSSTRGASTRTAASATAPGGPMPDWIHQAPDLAEARRHDRRPARRARRDRRTLERARGDRGTTTTSVAGRSAYDGWCGDRRFYPSAACDARPARHRALLRRRADRAAASAPRAARARRRTARSSTSTGT